MVTLINKNFFFIIIMILVVQINFGQTYNDEQTNEETVINNEELSRSIFANLGFGTETNLRNSQITGNKVFLSQIGEFNTASIITNTNASEINIEQNGNVNDVTINYDTHTAIADLKQNGNYNRIIDVIIDKNADTSLDLIQNGDDLLFVRNGINSLTKSIKFRQTEASPIIIINSYN